MARNIATILLVGPPQSGKTTASKFFERRGYKRISASGIVSRLDDPNKPISGRQELVARGERMLREQGPEWFAEKLMGQAVEHTRVVFDGIRPLRTIEQVIRSRPETKLVFIKANEAIRRARYEKDCKNPSISYDELLKTEVEQTSSGVEGRASIIYNEGTIEYL